jgi:catecholate siderophore receptor
MSFRIKPSVLAVVTALASLGPCAGALADTTLAPVEVRAQSERADGPVVGYNATRSATFTKTDTPLKEVPASLTVVPEELIEDQAMQSIADVIRYVPGATAHQGEGNRDQIVLRGIATTADFYVDGLRDDAQIFRDLYNLERVEVLKGPAGMVFGRGGAGGVVNRVSKKPVFGHVAEADLTVGTQSQLRWALDLGEKAGDNAAWRLNTMAESAGSFRDGVSVTRFAVNPSVTFLPGAQTAVTLSIEHAEDERTADRGLPSQNGKPYATSPSTFFGNASQSVSDSRVDALAVVVDHDFGAGTQLKNSLRVAQYDKLYQNVYAGSAVDATTGNMTINAYNNANQRINVFNQTDLTTRFKTGGLDHTLLAGVEVGFQDSESKRMTGFFNTAACLPTSTTTACKVSAGSPFAIATSFAPSATDANNRVKSDVAAVYVQEQLALSQQWKLLGGVRYDVFKVDFDDRRASGAKDLARTDKEFSPRAGVVWTPTAAQTYYASYSYAFLPSGEQLSLAPNTADLAPEKAKNYEVGARFDLTPKLALSTAIFRLDRDDVRVADPANPGFFVKTGQQRTEGVEVGLQGEVTRSWQVFAGYAHLDGRITKDTSNGVAGRKIGLVPENTVSIWNKLALSEAWGLGLGVVHQSESYTSFNNTVELPAFTRADGAIYYTLEGDKARLALNVENLFDTEYYPTANGDNNISPGAPRNARLTLSMKF